jgi:DNA-directed RNA polymerase subunit omega
VRPFPIEELVDRVGSRFTVVVAAAKRAKQLKDGAPPLVSLPTRNPLTIALHEIAAGLIQIGDAPEIPEEDVRAEEPAELAAPEVVDALLDKAAARGKGGGEDLEDDDELDEEIADDLEEEELEDEEEDEEEGEEEEEEEEAEEE